MLFPAGSIFTPGAPGAGGSPPAARVRSRSRPRRAPSSKERARPASILTESGSRIAPPRLRRPALRSASGDGRCSYTPAPLRSLYGLVARPALSCPSDNTQSGSRAKPESVFVFMPHEREQQGSGRAANAKLRRPGAGGTRRSSAPNKNFSPRCAIYA